MRARLFEIIVSITLALVPFTKASATEPWYGLRTYSSLQLNAAEGETYGLEVTILPSSDGMQMLWRLGNGRMERALLLDVVSEGKKYVVEVPPVVDGSGRWELTMRGNEAVAKGPRGQVFRLKRISH